MSTQIKTWQIIEGKLSLVESSLAEQGRKEAEHLEEWIASEPSILGSDIAIIGRQVMTQSGPLDLLGIDSSGNLVVVELKRERLPREAVAQAIDYAADLSNWSAERVSEECAKYTSRSLEDVLAETFDDVDLETLTVNEDQRIILVGFGAEAALVRMVEWLSSNNGLDINALILHYVVTNRGDELLTRTTVVSEDEQRDRGKRMKFKIAMSDEPGSFPPDELRYLLERYLTSGLWSARRIRDVLLPACLEHGVVTRSQLVQEIFDRGAATDLTTAGRFVSLISSQLGMKKNGFLRQAISYEYPDHFWQKDNYSIRAEYRDLIASLLEEHQEDAANLAV